MISSFFSDMPETFGHHPVVVSTDRTISYHQLDHYLQSAVLRLKERKIESGNRLAILAPNSLHYVILLLACWKMKIVPVLLNTRWPGEYLIRRLETVSCRHIIVTAESPLASQAPLAPLVPKLNLRTRGRAEVTTHLLEDLVDLSREPGSADAIPDWPLESDQLATVMFTSGSSGEPRAVVHTIGNHYHSALGANLNIPVGAGDRWLLSLPLYHVGGLAIVWRILLGGGALALPGPDQSLSVAIRTPGVTHVSLVATQLYHLLQDPGLKNHLQRLKAILLGGGPIPASLLGQAAEWKLPVFVSYGSTEMSSQITATRREDAPEKWKTAGRVLPAPSNKNSRWRGNSGQGKNPV